MKDKYEITLNATDNGNPSISSMTTLIVNVTDVNDNAPEVTGRLTGSVYENEPKGAEVMVNMNVKDADLGINAEIGYFLLNHLDLFDVDTRYGSITTKKPLDREEQDRYVLNIRVHDKGTPRLHVDTNITIKVLDVDDNCPIFLSPQYKATISENSTFGTFVVNVTALDLDIGTNAELDYGVLDGNDRGAFTVDSETGTVTVKKPEELNAEHAEVYWIKVRAGKEDCGLRPNDSDIPEGGKPVARNYTYTTVYIHLTDVNDNSPVFQNGKEKVFYNNMKLKELIRLNATDSDQGPGGEVYLYI